MATSSCSSYFSFLYKSRDFQKQISTRKNGGECSFHSRNSTNLQFLQRAPRKRGSNRDFFIRNASEEVAGDLLSSFSLPSIPGFSDSPWVTGIAGLLVVVPFLIQRLLILTKEVDIAAETVEKIADAVEKVAEEVDKAAEDIAEALPEGGLKKVVSFVEDLAEETAKDAQKVEDLMDKVEEMDDKLEAILEKQSKGTEKA